MSDPNASAASSRSLNTKLDDEQQASVGEFEPEDKPLAAKKKHKLQGGFDCIFVIKPPEQVQTDCSICLCVLKDPFLVGCCGNSFCRSCIIPILEDKKQCPLCNENFTTCIPDKRLQRTLNEMKVYCSHKGHGCEWIGVLCKLSQHLNAESESDELSASECSFTSIECVQCGERFQRKDIGKHKAQACLQRPYSCDYCNDYESTCEDVTTNHWPVCLYRPVPCPNDCGDYPERKNLECHVEKDCPFKVIVCPFNYAGCSAKMCRKDMQDHVKDSLADHVVLQAISHHKSVEKLEKRLISENCELKQKFHDLEVRFKECLEMNDRLLKEQQCRHENVVREHELMIKTLQKENQVLEDQLKLNVSKLQNEVEGCYKKIEEFEDLEESLHARMDDLQMQQFQINLHVHVAPLEFTLRDVSKYIVSNQSHVKEIFYSHPRGYKLALDIYPNGIDGAKGTHISMFLYLMRGDYDHHLNWPFRGTITIVVMSHEDDQNIVRHISLANTPAAERLLFQEVSTVGWGQATCISHAEIGANSKYVREDCLNLRIYFNP